MKRIALFVFLLGTAGMLGCETEPAGWSELDLMPYGLPITIQAPDSAEVKTMDMGILKDVTVKKGDDYFVQIMASEATTSSADPILADQKSAVQQNPYFSQFVREMDQGFLYETRIDSTNASYGFRYVYLKGNREFIFQTGLIGIFSREEAERMYEAVRQDLE